MATYFKGPIDHVGQSLNEKWTDLTTNKNFVEAVSSLAGGGGGTLEILSTYPTTDASKVGQKFIYKGNEWKYHSQAELDDLGWTTVSEGFPAPVRKIYDNTLFYLELEQGIIIAGKSGSYSLTTGTPNSYKIDFLGLGKPNIYASVIDIFMTNAGVQNTVTEFKNAALLTNLQDRGTNYALGLSSMGLTDSVIDDFFTQLPTTTKTVTLDVRSNPGSATCDPTIATNKGYTVITS